MRLDEFIAPPKRIMVTAAFNQTYSDFAAAKPELINKKFKDFVQAKLDGTPTTSDYAFQSRSPLGGYYHYHLLKGKMIIIYRKVGNDLRLYIVVEHKDYESKAAVRLANWLESLSDSDFIELNVESLFAEPQPKSNHLSPMDKEKLDGIIYDLISADGFYILKPAVEGNDWSNFFDWLETDMPNATPETVFAAYGGVAKLRAFILYNIAQFGKTEEYQKA